MRSEAQPPRDQHSVSEKNVRTGWQVGMSQGEQGGNDQSAEETTTSMAETILLPQRCSVGRHEGKDRKPATANAGDRVLFTLRPSCLPLAAPAGNSWQSRAERQRSVMAHPPFPPCHGFLNWSWYQGAFLSLDKPEI